MIEYSDDYFDGLRRLMRAVVCRAIRDMVDPSSPQLLVQDAGDWLLSPEAEIYLTECGLNHEDIDRWIDDGCPSATPKHYHGTRYAVRGTALVEVGG